MKRIFALILGTVIMAATLASCGNSGSDTITVVSREDGSGPRSAFVELMGMLQDDKDMTYERAEISNSTSVVMSTVAGNANAIGYISLGSLKDSVKAVNVDGVEATVDNIKSGSYKVSRPFNIATKDDLSDLAKDFISFILSTDGQAIVAEDYIALDAADSYTPSGLTGKITLAGSTSVSPLMEQLAAAYKELNPDVTIEIQQSGSSAGIQSAIEGVCDIGMASREIKEDEINAGLTPTVIALDGIAVIVNNDNEVSDLTSEQIKNIYTGEVTSWSDVK